MKTKYPNRCGKNNSHWKGGKVRRECEICGTSFLAHRCHIKRGAGRFCSNKCAGSFRSLALSGDKNPAWKGGITPEILKQRVSTRYEVWRDEVYKRDNATCQKCGAKEKLHVHHVIGFANKEIRADANNLVLLCVKCHRFVHSKKNINGEFIGKEVQE